MQYIVREKKAKGSNSLLGGGLLFFMIGMVFVLLGVFQWRANAAFFKNAEETIAQITNIDTYRDSDGDLSHRVYVTYTVDGNTYENRELGVYTSGMFVGDTITVYYNPQSPGYVQSKSGRNFMVIMCIGMGGIAVAVGGGMLLGQIKVFKKSRLKYTGSCIRLPITHIITTNMQINDVPGHVVVCDNPDPSGGKLATYRSDPRYTWLDNYMSPGDVVAIYYDPANPSYYYVDIDDVQKMEAHCDEYESQYISETVASKEL